MVIAIPIEENTSESMLSERFARSPFFAIIDKINTSIKIVDNPFYSDKKGVGNNILNLLIKAYSVDTIIGFELGLKVHELARNLNLNLIILNDKKKTLKSVLNLMLINSKH